MKCQWKDYFNRDRVGTLFFHLWPNNMLCNRTCNFTHENERFNIKILGVTHCYFEQKIHFALKIKLVCVPTSSYIIFGYTNKIVVVHKIIINRSNIIEN